MSRTMAICIAVVVLAMIAAPMVPKYLESRKAPEVQLYEECMRQVSNMVPVIDQSGDRRVIESANCRTWLDNMREAEQRDKQIQDWRQWYEASKDKFTPPTETSNGQETQRAGESSAERVRSADRAEATPGNVSGGVP